MDLPPPDARPSGVLFDRRSGTRPTDMDCGGSLPRNASQQCSEDSIADDARLFGFESELEANLTYIPMAVRFKLDKCGIKLSLTMWQLLPERRRRELVRAPCDNATDAANYRQVLCSFVKQSIGDQPPSIPTAEHPPWADDDIPEQISRAAAALGFPPPSSARWCKLTPLQRFALIKLSREGRDHRNLGPALREFGLLYRG
jgi:hypothetical protein